MMPNTKTQLLKESNTVEPVRASAIWTPEFIPSCPSKKLSWRSFRHMLFDGVQKLGNLSWSNQSFFDHLNSDVLIYFLNYLTSSGEIDILRRLLHADPKLKRLVVNILDNIDSSLYMPDVDPLLVRGVPRITLSDFHSLNPTHDLKLRPVRIFTIRDCGIGSLPISICEHRCCGVLPYLTRNTPVIIRTFGEHSMAVKRIRKWSSGLPIKFPLILIQDSDWKYALFDLSQYEHQQIKPPNALSIGTSHKPSMEERTMNPSLEFQNISDYGYFIPVPSRNLGGHMFTRIVSLNFTGECTSIDGSECCSPRFKLPVFTLSSMFELVKLAVSFDGPRFPSVQLICDLLDAEKRNSSTPEIVELVNNNWSEINPFGMTCKHSRNQGIDASQWCVDPFFVPPVRFANGRHDKIHTVEYVGLPDGALRLLDFDDVGSFTWRRMSPTKLPKTQEILRMGSVSQLSLFTLVREGEFLPVFMCPKLEKLTLVALENSVGGFDLDNLFNGATPKNLTSVRIIGTQLSRTCPDLTLVSERVERLSITGYVAQFVIDPSCALVFPQLEDLKIDVSQMPIVLPILSLKLKKESFPRLKVLRLSCSWKSNWRFDGINGRGASIKLELTDSCVEVCISSAVNINNIEINGTQCPYEKSSKYKDTCAIWVMEEDDKFSYTGLKGCYHYLDAYSE